MLRLLDRLVEHVTKRDALQAEISSLQEQLSTKSLSPQEVRYLIQMDGGATTNANIPVNPKSAMESWAVFACVRVLFESLGQSSFSMRQKVGDNSFREAPEHYLNPIISATPNSWMSSQNLREAAIKDLCLRGAAYWYKVIVRGQVRELLPISPDNVEILQGSDWSISYRVTFPGGSQRILTSKELVYIPWVLSSDYITPITPIQAQRESVANNKGSTAQTGAMLGNKAQVGGVLEHPGVLGDNAIQHLREGIKEKHTGKNAFGMMILEEDMKFKQTSMNNKDAQFLELSQATAKDICGIFRVPPQKIGIQEDSNYSNAELFGKVFVEDSLEPYSRRLTDAVDLQMLTPADRAAGYYAYHDLSGFMRGDAESRAKVHQSRILTGQETPNQALVSEGLNPLTDDRGNERLLPQAYLIQNEDGTYVSPSQISGLEPGEGGTAQPVPGNDDDDNGDSSDED